MVFMPRRLAPSSTRGERAFARAASFALTVVLVLLFASTALAQRVVLVRPDDSDTLLAEAFTRVRAELLLQDFEVVVVTSTGDGSPESIADAASRENAFAAIKLTRRAGGRSADVWLADRVTGKTTLRSLELAGQADAPSVLAVRTVDLLRSSLREFGPGRAPPPEVKGVVRGPLAPEIESFSAPAPSPFVLRVGAAALFQTSSPGAAYGPGLALEHRFSPLFRGGLAVAGPLLGASFRATSGRALVRQELAALEGTFVLFVRGAVELGVVAGVGVYHLEARAEVDPPFVARTDQVTSALASAGLELRFHVTSHVGAALGGQAMALAPRPGVAVGPERVLYRLPIVRAGAGVTVDF
jgi:hypothetical protein